MNASGSCEIRIRDSRLRSANKPNLSQLKRIWVCTFSTAKSRTEKAEHDSRFTIRDFTAASLPCAIVESPEINHESHRRSSVKDAKNLALGSVESYLINIYPKTLTLCIRDSRFTILDCAPQPCTPARCVFLSSQRCPAFCFDTVWRKEQFEQSHRACCSASTQNN